MKIKFAFFLFLFLIFSNCYIFSQNSENILNLEVHDSISDVEQLFVHTDRNIYSQGDTIWFCAWVRNKLTGSIENISNGLYVILIDEKGSLLDSVFFRITNGISDGYLSIPYDTISNFCSLRAWTTNMQNFESSNIFESTIQIKNIISNQYDLSLVNMFTGSFGKDTSEVQITIFKDGKTPAGNLKFLYRVINDNKIIETSNSITNQKGLAILLLPLKQRDLFSGSYIEIQVEEPNLEPFTISKNLQILSDSLSIQILPEGGTFVTNVNNRLGICTINNLGQPVSTNGFIVDDSGRNYGNIKTDRIGTSELYFRPEEQVNYYLMVQGIIRKSIFYKYPFPDNKRKGVAMLVNKSSPDTIIVNLKLNGDEFLDGQLALFMNGNIRLIFNLPENQKTISIKIPTFNLPYGIASIVYFTENNLPVAERLIEVNNYLRINFGIQLGAEKISASSKEFSIEINKVEKNLVPSVISISVVDSAIGYNINLYTPDIIESFLFNEIISDKVPARILLDGLTNLSAEELDRLLITYLWRSFQIPEKYFGDSSINRKKNYDSFQIFLKRINRKSKINELVSVANFESGYAAILSSDSNGLVKIPLRDIPDNSEYLFVQPKDFRVSISSAEIPYNLSFSKALKNKQIRPVIFQDFKVKTEDIISPAYKETIKLPEVKVSASRTVKYNNWFEKHYTPFGRVSTLKTSEVPPAYSVSDLLFRMFIRGNPLFVVDDLPIYPPKGLSAISILESYGVNSIQSITYLKGPQGFAIYGEGAEKGVVFITTKGNSHNINESLKDPKSIKLKYYNLFSHYRRFNNLALMQNANDPNNNPVYPPTLFWSPDYIIDQTGKSVITLPKYKQINTILISINGADIRGNLISTRASLRLR